MLTAMILNSTELRDYATVGAAVIALLVFLVNSYFQLRNRRLENLSRFFDVHRRLFASGGYLEKHLDALVAGTIARRPEDSVSEADFHTMMLEVERLAILANNNAVPESTQVYMFGWYAQRINKLVSDKERREVFWELALSYLQRLAFLADDYERTTAKHRKRFHS